LAKKAKQQTNKYRIHEGKFCHLTVLEHNTKEGAIKTGGRGERGEKTFVTPLSAAPGPGCSNVG